MRARKRTTTHSQKRQLFYFPGLALRSVQESKRFTFCSLLEHACQYMLYHSPRRSTLRRQRCSAPLRAAPLCAVHRSALLCVAQNPPSAALCCIALSAPICAPKNGPGAPEPKIDHPPKWPGSSGALSRNLLYETDVLKWCFFQSRPGTNSGLQC